MTDSGAFDLTILYGQLVVSAPGQAVGLHWTDAHVDQGFAWAPGSVSFGIPDHDGACRVEWRAGLAVLADEALWAIAVPFSTDGGVEVETIGMHPDRIDLAGGSYSLMFEALPGDDVAYRLRLTFTPDSAPDFAILRRGEGLATDTVLRRDADMA